MERYFHAEILEQKRQKELQQKNLNAKRRLQEIASGTQTQWSGNIKDLNNVTKVVESILSGKDLDSEYQKIISNLDIMRVDKLDELRSEILGALENDVYFIRKFSEYTELLGKSVVDSTQKRLLKKGGKDTVKFFDGR
jgi:transcriptional regulator with AAA-type ATPase domain